jgi:hypothetical protein
MKAELDAAMAEKQRVEDEASATALRIEMADALISGLSDEKVRGLRGERHVL